MRNVEGSYRSRTTSRGLLGNLDNPTPNMSTAPFPTDEEWAQAVGLAGDAAAVTWKKFYPFLQVGMLLEHACRTGLVKTALRDRNGGELIEQPRHFWNGERLWFRFDTCSVDVSAPFQPLSTKTGTSFLFIERKSFADWLQGTKAPNRSDQTQQATLMEQVREKRHAGRPPKYKWDEFASEVIRKVHDGDIPESDRGLATQMLEWCSETWGEEPGETTVREKLKILMREIA